MKKFRDIADKAIDSIGQPKRRRVEEAMSEPTDLEARARARELIDLQKGGD